MKVHWITALAFSCLLAVSLAQEDPIFYFAQMTDTHFGSSEHAHRTRDVVEQINKLPLEIAFVAHTGDIGSDNLDDGKTSDIALEVMNQLKVPIHYTPGNHDILRKRLDPTLSVYTNRFGRLAYSVEYHGVVMIFLYSEPLASTFEVKDYDALAELEKLLRATNGRPSIIFHHSPSVDDFYRNTMHDGWRADLREKWVRLINSYNVRAVVAGHFHRDEIHWLGKVPLYVSSSVAGYWGRQGSYRIYEYKDGRLSYRTQYLR